MSNEAKKSNVLIKFVGGTAFGGFGDWMVANYFRCESSGNLTNAFGDELVKIASAPMHIAIAGGHCGEADCTVCDPLERYVDGLTVRACLERYQLLQRHDFGGTNAGAYLGLTSAQKEAARVAWSAELKRKQAEAKQAEWVRVVCDDDRWKE